MSRLLPTSLLTTLVLSVVAAPPASSQWSPSGVRLCQVGCAGQGPQIISDGWGGAYIVWLESRNYSITDDDVYLQRVTATGEIAPGWPQDGFPVCVFPRTQYPQGIAPDGLGGVLVVWYDHRNVDLGTAQDLYAQRILADGTLAPGWPVNGAPVSRAPRFQGDAVIAPDGTGGAFVAWVDERDLTGGDVYAQHLTAGGSVAPGWPADGLGICVLPQGVGGPRIMPDGAGGFVVVWGDARRGVVDVYAQHLLADGSLAPGWAANGVPVALDRGIRQAVLDGAGGFYVGCVIVNQEFSDGEYYAQRFSFAGSRPAGWPEGGVRVCGAPGNRESLELSPDGVGGALLAWYDYRPPPTGGEIYAARVRADGALAPGWPVDGLRVSDAGGPGFEFFESLEAIANRAVIREGAAEPALGDIGHIGPLGFALDQFLGLTLGANEQNQPALADDLRQVTVAAKQSANAFPEVDDVDEIALAVNVRPHFRVPAASPVPIVDAGVEHFLDLHDSHAALLGYLFVAETIMSNLRTKGKRARPVWRER